MVGGGGGDSDRHCCACVHACTLRFTIVVLLAGCTTILCGSPVVVKIRLQ